ncbi:helix-turn-helix domain-containing protein [uncultured Tateyamaria sp.]|uniref:helix-turn-helix domain-containing protein n=1 Tax=uncultured Tateyamaria sp. TaxID=455651 RepID=UPI00261CEEBF|nr:AraC family transcriptional regulator [uncultured Tateyamaria sp.]
MNENTRQSAFDGDLLDVTGSLDSLLIDGRINVETGSIFADDFMQYAQFRAGTHASRGRMHNKITLVYSNDVDGNLDARLDGGRVDFAPKPGMLYFVPEKIVQEYEFSGEARNTAVTLDADFLRSVADANPEFRNSRIDEPRFPFRNPNIVRKMSALVSLAGRQDMGWRTLSEACRLEIAVELLKSLNTDVDAAVSTLSQYELNVIKDYVRANLENNIGLESASALIGRDIYGFGRAFKAATGRTFHQYVTFQRIDEARRLLTQTSMPIIEVAYASGFSSQAHLTTVMGRHLGLTPAVIRKSANA